MTMTTTDMRRRFRHQWYPRQQSEAAEDSEVGRRYAAFLAAVSRDALGWRRDRHEALLAARDVFQRWLDEADPANPETWVRKQAAKDGLEAVNARLDAEFSQAFRDREEGIRQAGADLGRAWSEYQSLLTDLELVETHGTPIGGATERALRALRLEGTLLDQLVQRIEQLVGPPRPPEDAGEGAG